MTKKSRIALIFLKLFQDESFIDPVSGDMEELYKDRIFKYGKFKSDLWLLKQVLRSIPVFLSNKLYRSVIMFRNYIKISFRNLLRHKGYSFLNISGLSIGIACFLLMILYVQYELGFDKFHE